MGNANIFAFEYKIDNLSQNTVTVKIKEYEISRESVVHLVRYDILFLKLFELEFEGSKVDTICNSGNAESYDES